MTDARAGLRHGEFERLSNYPLTVAKIATPEYDEELIYLRGHVVNKRRKEHIGGPREKHKGAKQIRCRPPRKQIPEEEPSSIAAPGYKRCRCGAVTEEHWDMCQDCRSGSAVA